MSLPTPVRRAVPPSARRRPSAAGPRLLLPPVPEQDMRPEVTTAAAFLPPGLRSVRSAVTELPWPVPAARRELPPRTTPSPGAVCGPVVVAAVEALAGIRPLAQLTRWVSPQVYEALALRIGDPRPGPVRRALVRSTRVCRLAPDVAEATVVVHDGTRVRAAALRLELRRDQWRATVLQIG